MNFILIRRIYRNRDKIEMKIKNIFLIIFLGVFLGCSSYGPVSSQEFSQLVQTPLPSNSGKIVLSGTGSWFPNAQGFNDTRSSFLAPPIQPIPGIVVITDKELFFQQWNKKEKKYKIMLRIGFEDIESLSLDKYGLNRRLVIQKKDYSFHTFDFTRGKGQFINGSKTEEAYSLIKQATQKNGGNK